MTGKNIKLAKYSGFCYGVKRAVETAKKIKEDNPNKNVYILGELIHNTDVINELENSGIKTIYEVPSQGDGICIIRSHGEAPQVFEKLKNAGFEIIDLTCPDVKKVQQKAIELAKNNYFVIIVGKANHPEVIAIKANADLYSQNVLVATDINQIKEFEDKIKSHKKVGIVVQTTQMLSALNNITNYINSIAKEVLVYNTICQSTAMRQAEAKELAKNSDLMIVVGSKKSANTTHLAEILKDYTQTIHLENEFELENYKNIFDNIENIGITAGASTPENIILNVIDKINK
ncbi:4-hydroxy-3-methylbut-2-enyl diphosphate reductase [bacterium]|nr:4-hydroxy-3-methylbut-2-enyl diphosphate reductase [bacterium]